MSNQPLLVGAPFGAVFDEGYAISFGHVRWFRPTPGRVRFDFRNLHKKPRPVGMPGIPGADIEACGAPRRSSSNTAAGLSAVGVCRVLRGGLLGVLPLCGLIDR